MHLAPCLTCLRHATRFKWTSLEVLIRVRMCWHQFIVTNVCRVVDMIHTAHRIQDVPMNGLLGSIYGVGSPDNSLVYFFAFIHACGVCRSRTDDHLNNALDMFIYF